jgi:myo-inositol-1(or 4)-monophosphatase
MNAADLSERAAFAMTVVREAGALALKLRAEPSALGIEAKGPRDFVTAADKAVETFIKDRICLRFGDVMMGEEFGGDASVTTQWIVDPIDGTYNYMHSNPRWCVSLGLIVDGVPELGLIYAPQTEDMYVARRGEGATRNGHRLTVSSARFASAPLVEVGASTKRGIDHYLNTVRALMTANIETRRYGSGALGLAQVATGEIDGYTEDFIYPWDVAAGLLMVTEAGGRVSDFFSGDSLKSGNSVLASAPWLAPQLTSLTGITLGTAS